MKIIVKHDRDDLGWIVTREGQFATKDQVIHKELLKAVLTARKEYPDADVMVDDRVHSKLGNGMGMIKGEQDLQPVEFR